MYAWWQRLWRWNSMFWFLTNQLHILTSTPRLPEKSIRVSDDLYEAMREIKLSLESQYQSAAPSIQDLVTVALKGFIENWQDSAEQPRLLAALLNQRKVARSKMGRKGSK
jgi:hypothetical protein